MIKQKLTYLSNYLFLKRNFFLLLAIGAFSYYWYTHFSSLQGDSARVQIVLSVISLAVCGTVFLFSLLSCVPPYLALWFKKRVLEVDKEERKDIIKVKFQKEHPTPGVVNAEVRIYGIRKPLLGFAKVKIIFEDLTQTEDILLTHNIKEKRRRVGIMGRKAVSLPNIRDYRIQSSFIHFEDFFHFFSLPYREVESIGLFTEPPANEEEELDFAMPTSEEPVLKVVQHKFTKGELLDYKKYAPGDDIRRIIWKNYARSRELTVRTFDRTFPYVSHINVLTCFYDASPSREQGVEIKDYLLDIYKEKIRQVVDSIIEQEFTVKYLTDQAIEDHYELDEYQKILYSISAAKWQKEKPADAFIRENYQKMRGASNLLIVSSLCPTSNLQQVNNNGSKGFNLCVYTASNSLNKIKKPSVLKQVFTIDSREPMDAARRKINARPTIKFINENDQRFKEKFDKQNETVIEL